VAALGGSTALLGYAMRSAAAEPPPEIGKIRLVHAPGICLADEVIRWAGAPSYFSPWFVIEGADID